MAWYAEWPASAAHGRRRAAGRVRRPGPGIAGGPRPSPPGAPLARHRKSCKTSPCEPPAPPRRLGLRVSSTPPPASPPTRPPGGRSRLGNRPAPPESGAAVPGCCADEPGIGRELRAPPARIITPEPPAGARRPGRMRRRRLGAMGRKTADPRGCGPAETKGRRARRDATWPPCRRRGGGFRRRHVQRGKGTRRSRPRMRRRCCARGAQSRETLSSLRAGSRELSRAPRLVACAPRHLVG